MVRKRIQYFWPIMGTYVLQKDLVIARLCQDGTEEKCKCKTYARPSVPAFFALIFALVAQVLLPVRVSDVSIQQYQIKIKMHFSFSTKWLSLKEKLCTQ